MQNKLQVKLIVSDISKDPWETKREKLKVKTGNRMQKWTVTQQHTMTTAIHEKG